MNRVRLLPILLMLALAGCLPFTPPAPLPATNTPLPATSVPDTPVPPTPDLPPLGGAVVEHPRLASFHMLNRKDGWGLSDTALLRTDDGGATWHDRTPPGAAAAGFAAQGDYLDAARAALLIPDAGDPLHTGTVFLTLDGGASWTSHPAPFGSGQLRFLPGMQNGWAMAGLGVGAGSNAIAIFRTSDGGANWQQVFTDLPTDPAASDEIPLGGLKGVFFALDAERAWVGGVIYSDNTSYLYRTDDGGQHWSQVELEPPDEAPGQWSVESIQFASPSIGFLSLRVSAQASSLAVYASQDEGDSWDLTPASIPDGRAADFVSETEGFVFDGTDFLSTRDAGQTWERIAPDVVFSESFMSMDFVDAQTGWVAALDPTTSEVGFYKTTDGGRTWELQ